jgi:HEAT repeat protein
MLHNERLDMSVRTRAVAELSRRFEGRELEVVLRFALESRHEAIRAAAVRAAAAENHRPLLDLVRRIADRELSPSLAEAVAEALAARPDPVDEPLFLTMLTRHEPAVHLAAAKALAAVGTIAAVEPLLRLTEGVLRHAGVKEAAREAVRAIQARLGPADAGQLSVSAPAALAGALSTTSSAGLSVVSQSSSADDPEHAHESAVRIREE